MSVTHRQSDKRDSTVIADVSLRCAVKKSTSRRSRDHASTTICEARVWRHMGVVRTHSATRLNQLASCRISSKNWNTSENDKLTPISDSVELSTRKWHIHVHSDKFGANWS